MSIISPLSPLWERVRVRGENGSIQNGITPSLLLDLKAKE